MKMRWPVRVALSGVACGACACARAAPVKWRGGDTAGMPVAGAEIRVFRKARSADGRRLSNEPVQLDGKEGLRTDAEGRFETTDLFDRDTPLRVIVVAEGTLANRSAWITPGDDDTVTVPNIVLRQMRIVPGRVVDRQGRPVAGAGVFNVGDAHQRMETTTDAEGRFQLAGVPEGRAFLFVEKAGFRFTGKLLAAENKLVELELASDDEDVEPLRTLPAAMPHDEEKKLALRVLEPYLQIVKSGAENDNTLLLAIYRLALVDTIAAFEGLGTMPFTDPSNRESAIEGLVSALVEMRLTEDWDEVQSWIETAEHPATRAACYVFAARKLPGGDRKQKWLDEALVQARRENDPAPRALALGRIAHGLFDQGNSAQAKELAREALRLVEQLPVAHDVPWNTTGTVARVVGRFDLPAALALLERLHHDGPYCDQMGRLACELALRDGAEAERVWRMAGQRDGRRLDALPLWWRDAQLGAPLCYRLTKLDSSRARRMAWAMGDATSRIAALGAVARMLGESEEAAAATLLRELTRIELPRDDTPDDHFDPSRTEAVAICRLLPLLERIDGQLGREFLWRTVARRMPRPAAERLDDETERADLALIAMLSRYDWPLARAMLEPLAGRLEEFSAGPSGACAGEVVGAAAAIDPHWAERMLDRVPAPIDSRPNRPINWARLELVRMIGTHDHLRWELIGYDDPARYDTWD